MKSKNKSGISRPEEHIEIDVNKAVMEDINNMVDKLNKGSLELFPTMIAGYYLSRDTNEIVNSVLTEEQDKEVRKLTGLWY